MIMEALLVWLLVLQMTVKPLDMINEMNEIK